MILTAGVKHLLLIAITLVLLTYDNVHIGTTRDIRELPQLFQKILLPSKMFRSSRPKVFCKKGAIRNFTKFSGKHLCQGLIFNEVAGLRLATLSKMRFWHRCFPVNFVEFLRTLFFIEHLWWLLQNVL